MTQAKIKAINKILQITQTRNFEEIHCSFNSYVNVLGQQLRFFDGYTTKAYRVKYETLLFKMMLAGYSLSYLVKGTNLEQNSAFGNIFYPDISSCKIIARSIFENYLTIFYLFSQVNDDEDMVLMRNVIYELASLIKRQESKSEKPEHRRKMIKERELIIFFRNNIKKNKHFFNLEKKVKDKILNCNESWRFQSKLKNWTQLFRESDLSDEIFQPYWSIYSSYAHSESLSVIQLNEYTRNAEAIINFQYEILKTTGMIICNQIIANNHYLSELNKIFEEVNPVIREEIKLWTNLSHGKRI